MIPFSDDNPTRTVPYITLLLITLCTLAFAWELSLASNSDSALTTLGLTPDILLHRGNAPGTNLPAWATILTSMFLHGSVLHIVGNMLYLWIFGNNIEEALGHARYFTFYFACGIAAAMTMVFVEPSSHTPIVGASGAISGVLGAYILLYPRSRVHVMVPLLVILYPFWIRAVWVIGVWFVVQLAAASLTPTSEPGVAWWAHVGGFATGILLTPLMKRRAVPFFGPYDPRGPWG